MDHDYQYPAEMLIKIDFTFTRYKRLSDYQYLELQRMQPGYLAYLDGVSR